MGIALLSLVLFALPARAAQVPDSLSQAAQYYYSRYDYRQAFRLWTEAYRRQPDSVTAVVRLAELKLMFEGRPAARDILLKFLNANPKGLSAESKQLVRDKLAQLQSTFLTDEGQSTFLQALPKVKRKDCPAAVPLLTQAIGIEPGNLRVLREKAKCEKAVGSFDPFYETLKQAYAANPFDGDVVDNLSEAHLYYHQPALTVALLQESSELRTARQRTALGIALAETGDVPGALSLLQPLHQRDKIAGLHPAVLFALGKIFAARGDANSEATHYLDRFVSTMHRPENALIDGWDPYRSAENLDEAQKLLTSLK